MTILAKALTSKAVKFIGASTDTKPTIASHTSLPEPVVGSTFYEYDTNNLYITYDGTNWVQKDVNGIGEWIAGVIDIDRASEFSGDDVDRFSEVIDLGADYMAVVIEIPTIDSATVSIHVMRDSTVTTVPKEVHYTKSDDTTAHWTTTAGTGLLSITLFIGGYQYIRIHTSANQTADRTFYCRGVSR